jgi:predicted MFS family arabinose efflux permease
VTTRAPVLTLILVAQTVANVGPLGLPSIAPLVREDLGLSVAQAGSFLSAYYTGAALMSLPAGWLSDRSGVRAVMALGQAVIAAGLLAAAAAPGFPLISAALVLAGAGYGALNPTTSKAVLLWFPRRRRATVLGLKQMGFPLGGALGAATMPAVALWLGWRGAVTAAALIVLVLALVTLLGYRDPAGPGEAAGHAGASRLSEVLASRDLWLVALATMVFAGVQTALLGFLVLYLGEVLGLPLTTAAGYLALAQVAGMAGRVGFGIVSDRLLGGRRLVVLFAAGLGSAASALGLAATGAGTPAWALAPLALLLGVFGVGWNGVQHSLLAELAGPRGAGTAVGLGLAVSSVGVIVWPPLFGLAVEWFGGFRPAWIGLAASIVVALALLARVKETRMAR